MGGHEIRLSTDWPFVAKYAAQIRTEMGISIGPFQILDMVGMLLELCNYGMVEF